MVAGPAKNALMKIRKNDQVVVITGDQKSPQPRRVMQVLDGEGKVLVQGVHVVRKHVKKGHPKSPNGGRLETEMPIPVDRVAYYCESCQSKSKLGYRYDDEGAKERYCRKCSATINRVSPPKAKYAKA